jgi:hypothetical protein
VGRVFLFGAFPFSIRDVDSVGDSFWLILSFFVRFEVNILSTINNYQQ